MYSLPGLMQFTNLQEAMFCRGWCIIFCAQRAVVAFPAWTMRSIGMERDNYATSAIALYQRPSIS